MILDELVPAVRDRVKVLGPIEGEALIARLEQHHLDIVEPLEHLYGDGTDLAILARAVVDVVVDAALA
ncbi:MAG: hypothetical protein QOE40_652, partial [Actinomycetota bacterium]|nr:hypothetical protein [Actinomycetota bacterium]